MVDQPSKAENTFYRMSARELFVDFFGSLVPGMVFILLAAIVLVWPVLAFLPNVPTPCRWNRRRRPGRIGQPRRKSA